MGKWVTLSMARMSHLKLMRAKPLKSSLTLEMYFSRKADKPSVYVDKSLSLYHVASDIKKSFYCLVN